jgi:putative ABC transport system substrate-binding protein
MSPPPSTPGSCRIWSSRASNVSGTIHIAPIVAQVNTMLAYRAIKRLGVVFNPAERNSVLAVEGLRQEWGKRGLTLFANPRCH